MNRLDYTIHTIGAGLLISLSFLSLRIKGKRLSVTCRMVCTYGDVGTEWLEDAYVDRRKLGSGSGGLTDELSGLIMDTNAIQTIPAYAVGLLKGSCWEGNEQHGAVHRSPQLTHNSPKRLLLTLDFG